MNSQRIPIRLLHVGLPRCASTYLQSILANASEKLSTYNGYKYSNLHEFAFKLRELVGKGIPPQKIAENTSLLRNFVHIPGQRTHSQIASSEGFFWGWLHEPDRHNEIPALIEASVKSLSRVLDCGYVLLVIRDPVRWMSSVHGHLIKEGRHGTFAEIYPLIENLFWHTLNLEHILALLQKHFNEVLILSQDELRQSPVEFWHKLFMNTGIPAIPMSLREMGRMHQQSTNASDPERIQILEHMNRYYSRMLSIYASLNFTEPAPFPTGAEERKRFFHKVSVSDYYAHRRIIEFATEDQINAIRDLLDIRERSDFSKVTLCDDMAAHLRDNFIKPLEEWQTIPAEYIEQYKRSIDAAVQG
jgi:hypothetical protein